jgi:fatty acid/phospholipid biosynthesis enzyme
LSRRVWNLSFKNYNDDWDRYDGGDYAPLEAVKGLALYLADAPVKVKLLLVGDNNQIHQLISEHKIDSKNIEVVHAEQVIDMHEHPTKALREKQNLLLPLAFICWQRVKWMPSSAQAIPALCS